MQGVLEGWKTSTQVFAVPEQWSEASSLQAPPCEAPVQCRVLDAKASLGQAVFDPSQFSATSH